MNKNNSQEVIRSRMMTIAGSGIFIFAFLWLALDTFLAESFGVWWTGLFWIALIILHFLIVTPRIDKLQRASQVHLSFYILSLLGSVIIFDVAIRIISTAIKFNLTTTWFFIIISLFATFIGLIAQTQYIRSRLRAAIQHNIDSGRLDLQTGQWNLGAPLYTETPEQEKTKSRVYNSIAKLSPIVTAISLSIARSIDGELQTFIVGLCLYGLFYVFAWGSARESALVLQLREWEKEYNVKINI